MYWATFSWITSQPASTTMMVMKLLSRTNSTEMPSTPRKYLMLKRGIQGAISTNCMPAGRRFETGVERQGDEETGDGRGQGDSQRASGALRSEPGRAPASAPRIGTQIARLSSG